MPGNQTNRTQTEKQTSSGQHARFTISSGIPCVERQARDTMQKQRPRCCQHSGYPAVGNRHAARCSSEMHLMPTVPDHAIKILYDVITTNCDAPLPMRSVAISTQVLPALKLSTAAVRALLGWSPEIEST